MLIKGLVIKDLHFGHKRTKEMYEELKIVKDYLNDNEIHILNINGDYFDRKLIGTEPAIFYAITFFSELVEICKRKNIKIRIIQGTRSHELNQLTTMFQHYLDDEQLDIKIFMEITKETLMGTEVLYVPEEYPESKDYYDEWKKGSYNIVHGHGTWDFVHFAVMMDQNEEEGGSHGAPVFVYEEWKEAIKNGLAIFGHIHKRQSQENVFYGGSFTAWGYGDRSKKGFSIYTIDNESNKWTYETIDNEQAPSYTVTSIKKLFKDEDINNVLLEDIQKKINEEADLTDNLRVDLSGLTDDRIKIFKEVFKDNPKIKIEIKKRKTMLKESTEPAIYDKYGYILKRELPIDETVKKFVLDEYETNIDLERVKELIAPTE
jgi:hypothetical protein